MNWQAILSSFALVAVSEMGDKTQLLAFSLASRYRRPWPLLAGMTLATAVNHALAASLGAWISAHVPTRVMAGVLAATFLGFGLWTLRPEKDDDDDEAKSGRMGPFLAAAWLFFIAEMGDKTQLAAIALAARFHSIAQVTLGTTLGMVAADGLAVLVGDRLASRMQGRWLRVVAASLFLVFGLASAWTAIRG